MFAMHDLTMMLLSIFAHMIIGIAVLAILVVASYFFRDSIRIAFFYIWKLLHKKSYEDFTRREEAARGYKEPLR